ncbi:hypothetical protein SAMN05443667_105207 [Flavobacterium gillisiae]|uniref:Uncharacterized protein n=1 Tax=Flavobacterium gillisiae TaxID=150146 RepID=A0A1H4C3M3_9FLAO|nr:hypothetical protein [Flavobacterium gillisiae]SEA54986.1 hypothetical protein SAMN05443667_105207 [Flavobacterium gillisiae]
MKTKITLLLFINMIAMAGYGQYDWTQGQLILKNADTLVGEIRVPMISKNLVSINGEEKISFRKDRKSEKVKYGESQVDKVIFKNSDSEVAYFEYINLSETKKGLFKIITKGKANLYARNVSISSGGYMTSSGVSGGMWNYSTTDFNEFYILRENELAASPLATARISRSFNNRAIEYFSDCPSLVSKLEAHIYGKNDILKVVEEYNKICL